ncbi:MAG: 50S ribosomal protein L29 [Candidatus Doudnabacteria bacterium RIFCSPHIGHO2_02_FULL_48_21]|uniref:Large ribosomal subunit protein uL29 n=1 Tax=Candidatus Doudnabacteria bacterium RIFCSPLOWO2_02_FULL_48_13 TaxID=1817845 RepID=A0A1F5QC17_9BACT|nr:MAG: 50S ribosomal protein L29 [Candidatus Doudnabacteria bacterium RIFCSPHIGHO2_01_48_18]OGE77515.1 MAG: 50S ribosomal protein L29 [Candidatus Doudnabacteria bacterium RIFCSPHIGHO2_01_FULL_48_180]OGE91656.1 MAG: 50S ribosomal protein L29 [Candidatus Doudnabacteria bacterium RIFCSPHIGHO2_12_FULL_47_25]OGE93350.1 MAG: 50S ribosomal protein L29 [Candidatus Doudnabacteria bacterium RIFCSPHIGHO2_02_FULL_48_21]OGE97434.1 MAG: 50S ribosomal protein L29 [Candidatus Doudnabacteria bacterium RIFCSPLO
MTKITDIRKKSDADLEKLLLELKGSVRDLRFKIANKELKNHQQLKATRRDIARILTVFKEKGLKG